MNFEDNGKQHYFDFWQSRAEREQVRRAKKMRLQQIASDNERQAYLQQVFEAGENRFVCTLAAASDRLQAKKKQ